MAFLGALIQTLIKMVIVGAFAFGGIKFGQMMRRRKDAKNNENSQA